MSDLIARLQDMVDFKHDDMDVAREAIEEIARLRALCDRQSTALSLSGMRHGRILVGLERRNRRQRRALAKLYQRRHDKNAALATARREGTEEAAKIAEGEIYNERYRTWPWWEDRPGYGRGNVSEDSQLVLHCDAIAAAIRAAAKEEK